MGHGDTTPLDLAAFSEPLLFLFHAKPERPPTTTRSRCVLSAGRAFVFWRWFQCVTNFSFDKILLRAMILGAGEARRKAVPRAVGK
jgi:hypothetical protein